DEVFVSTHPVIEECEFLDNGIGSVLNGVLLRHTHSMSREHLFHLPYAGYQCIDIGSGVVQGEGGAHRTGYPKSAHERLRAVVASPHGDAETVQDGAGIVGMHVIHEEGHHRGLVGGLTVESDSVYLAQLLGGIGEQVGLVSRDAVMSDLLHELHGLT